MQSHCTTCAAGVEDNTVSPVMAGADGSNGVAPGGGALAGAAGRADTPAPGAPPGRLTAGAGLVEAEPSAGLLFASVGTDASEADTVGLVGIEPGAPGGPGGAGGGGGAVPAPFGTATAAEVASFAIAGRAVPVPAANAYSGLAARVPPAPSATTW